MCSSANENISFLTGLRLYLIRANGNTFPHHLRMRLEFSSQPLSPLPSQDQLKLQAVGPHVSANPLTPARGSERLVTLQARGRKREELVETVSSETQEAKRLSACAAGVGREAQTQLISPFCSIFSGPFHPWRIGQCFHCQRRQPARHLEAWALILALVFCLCVFNTLEFNLRSCFS